MKKSIHQAAYALISCAYIAAFIGYPKEVVYLTLVMTHLVLAWAA